MLSNIWKAKNQDMTSYHCKFTSYKFVGKKCPKFSNANN